MPIIWTIPNSNKSFFYCQKMSYSSSVTTVLQRCPEFTHVNLIATRELSWVVLFTNNLRRCHNFASFRSCDFYWDKRWQNNKRIYKRFFVNVVNVYHIYDENHFWQCTEKKLHFRSGVKLRSLRLYIFFTKNHFLEILLLRSDDIIVLAIFCKHDNS